MPTELPKQYDPQEAQTRFLAWWDERGFAQSRPDANREPFTIVIPPPNVTGALHMGHALNNTLQDVLIRWRRMQGRNALWVPGTDHAGIATQAVVERLLLQLEKKTRHDIGREALVQRIWQWKDQYETRILNQLKQLGSSCDFTRTRFTLDEGCSRAVRQTFFDFFKAGLIFRGKRLVNWDTHLQTAVADDEIYEETIKGGFWTFRYPVLLPGGEGSEYIRFSTTRPETMLGDTAVAVHPDDPRYQHLIGKMVTIPLVNRQIPIIADATLVDPKLGTGCVKVTPAHDRFDYECGLRHKLPMINILNSDGTINENGGKYRGLDRYKARDAVIADMEALGLFDGKEDRDIPMKYSDRSKTPIEPYLSDQWFVKMGDLADGKPGLAQMAMDAVSSGKVKIFPERYAKTYLDWLGEKRDWCISRQLWWGHRIPIWYAKCSEADLKKEFADRKDVTWTFDDQNDQWLICAVEDISYTNPMRERVTTFTQDPDVLDTWFSSALWPHSTLGWPEQTTDLRYYYPTSVLITSRDIITLWVARMVMTGLFNCKDIPFRHVYIHAKILDGFGEGMSKSKGNGVDPLDIISLYGADALRYTMMAAATETQDSRLPVSNVCPHCGTLMPQKQEHQNMRTKKVTCASCKKPFRPGGPWPTDDPELPTAKVASDRFEIGRNFANKLWNAARFLLMNLEGYTPGMIRRDELPIEDRWILSRLARITHEVTEQLEGYHFADVARSLYEFTWSEFCDWYVEMAKSRLKAEGGRMKEKDEGGRMKDEENNSSSIHPSSFIPHPSGDPYGEQRVLAGTLDTILRLLHPVMPFVTEAIWQAMNEAAFERGLPSPQPSSESVMIAEWPHFCDTWMDTDIEKRIGRMQELVRAVRNIRNQFMVNEKADVEIFVKCSDGVAADFASLQNFIKQLAKVSDLSAGPSTAKPAQSATFVHGDFELYVSLKGLIDVEAEVKRLEKQKAEKEKQLAGIRAKLTNASFVDRAPPEVVQQQRDQERDVAAQISAIGENLGQLRGG